MKTARSIVGYCRSAASSSSALTGQKLAIRAYAKRHGLTVSRFYCDAGASGLTLDSEGLSKLLRDATAQRIGKVLVVSRDRISRNVLSMQTLIQALRRTGTCMVFLDGSIDQNASARIRYGLWAKRMFGPSKRKGARR